MRYVVVLLAIIVGVTAQFGDGQYNPFNPYNRNPYQRDPYNRNAFNRNPYNRYKTYSTNTPFRYSTTTTSSPTGTPSSTPVPFSPAVPVPVVPRVVSDDSNAEILRFENDSGPDGSFSYAFETSNGIAAQEQGVPRDLGGNPPVIPVVVQGSFSWTSRDGQPVAIAYVADENGYRATGDAIPTPPPLPPQIARALARTLPHQK